ncbi:MAG: hypothetical protein AAF626_18235 [Pseudomonadota bacterium]
MNAGYAMKMGFVQHNWHGGTQKTDIGECDRWHMELQLDCASHGYADRSGAHRSPYPERHGGYAGREFR